MICAIHHLKNNFCSRPLFLESAQLFIISFLREMPHLDSPQFLEKDELIRFSLDLAVVSRLPVTDLRVCKFSNCGESSFSSGHKKQTEPVHICGEKNAVDKQKR